MEQSHTATANDKQQQDPETPSYRPKLTNAISLIQDLALPKHVVFTSAANKLCSYHISPHPCLSENGGRCTEWVDCTKCLQGMLGIDATERDRVNQKNYKTELWLIFGTVAVIYIVLGAFHLLLRDECRPRKSPLPTPDGQWSVWFKAMAGNAAEALDLVMVAIGSVVKLLWRKSGAIVIVDTAGAVLLGLAKAFMTPWVWMVKSVLVSRSWRLVFVRR
jgi:hypothetical protein